MDFARKTKIKYFFYILSKSIVYLFFFFVFYQNKICVFKQIPPPACAPFLVELSRDFRPYKAQSILLGQQPQNNAPPNQAVFAHPSTKNAKQFPFEPEIYPRPDGTIYVCGISDRDPLPDDPSTVKGDAEKAKLLFQFASSVMMTRTDNDHHFELLESNACYLPTPADERRPLIGAIPETDSTLFVCAGHTCWGILNSLASGLAIREMIQHDSAVGKELLLLSSSSATSPQTFRIREFICEELEPKNRLTTSFIEKKKESDDFAPTKRTNEKW